MLIIPYIHFHCSFKITANLKKKKKQFGGHVRHPAFVVLLLFSL